MTKTTLQLFAVALLSALLSVLLYRQFESPQKVYWNSNDDDGEARYVKLVDKLFDTRSTEGFVSAAPTDFITAAEIASPAVGNIRAPLETRDSKPPQPTYDRAEVVLKQRAVPASSPCRV